MLYRVSLTGKDDQVVQSLVGLLGLLEMQFKLEQQQSSAYQKRYM